MANVESISVGGTSYSIRDANAYTKSETDALLDEKVDAVSGKGLSANDYTTAEKNKLAGIAAGAQVNSITGVKGNAETDYRTGNINLTSVNIGAVDLSLDQTIMGAKTFTSVINAPGLATSSGNITMTKDGTKSILFLNSTTDAANNRIAFIAAQTSQTSGSDPNYYNRLRIGVRQPGASTDATLELQYHQNGNITISIPGVISGNGSGLTNLNASSISSGAVPIGNGGTGASTAAAALAALGAVAQEAEAVPDLDDCDDSGLYKITSANANTKYGINNGLNVLHIKYNGTYATQIAFGMNSDAVYYRRKKDTWLPWRPLTLGTAVSTNAASSLMGSLDSIDRESASLDVMGDEDT